MYGNRSSNEIKFLLDVSQNIVAVTNLVYADFGLMNHWTYGTEVDNKNTYKFCIKFCL
jgi:hypothetical protein